VRRISPLAIVPFVLSIAFGVGWLTFDWMTRAAISTSAEQPPSRAAAAQGAAEAAAGTKPQETADGADPLLEDVSPASDVPRPNWRRPADEAAHSETPSSPGAATSHAGSAAGSRDGVAPSRRIAVATRPAHGSAERREDGNPPPPTPANSTTTRPEEPGSDQKPNDKESDTEPPTLVDIQFTPSEIHDGGESGVTMTVTDNLSGVRVVSGSIRSPGSGATLGFTGQRQGTADTWAARVGMPIHAEEGVWYVNQVRLQDNANNINWITWTASSAPSGARLSVVSSEADSLPPNITSISVDRPNLDRGEKNTVHVGVTDDNSGVGAVYGMFTSPNGTANITFHCREERPGTWVGDVLLPADADCGEWKLRYVAATDKANNRVTLDANDERVKGVTFFLSFSGQCDSTAPVVSLVTISPTAIDNASATTVTVQAWVTDDASGVRVLTGRVSGPSSGSAQPPSINFGFKPGRSESDPWSATFVVPQYSAKGHWTFQSLQAIDKASNRRTYTASDPVLSGVGFDVN